MKSAYNVLIGKAELRGWLMAYGMHFVYAKKIANYCARYYQLVLMDCNTGDGEEAQKRLEKEKNALQFKIKFKIEMWREPSPFNVDFFNDPRGAVVIFKHLESGQEFYF